MKAVNKLKKMIQFWKKKGIIMKKLLAIILAVVCIIPTMAVSFSVSAKATSNQVKTTNVSLYQYG